MKQFAGDVVSVEIAGQFVSLLMNQNPAIQSTKFMARKLGIWCPGKFFDSYEDTNFYYYRFDGSGWIEPKRKGIQRLIHIIMLPMYLLKVIKMTLALGEYEALIAIAEEFCERIPLEELPIGREI